MKLIDKDALVAELKKRIRDYWSDSENTMGIYPHALEEVIKYTETLEVVKEVDLEKVANQSGYAAYPVDMAEEFGGVIRDNNRYQRSSYIKGFIAGANWQKEQMMKGAIDGVLSSTITGSEQVVSACVGYGELGKNGDKVKIIIFKKE